MSEVSTLSTLFSTLACAALNPGLRSILIFDAPYAGLQQVASLLEPLLVAVSELPVRRYQLNVQMQDDEVWGTLWLPGQGSKGRPLLFSAERNAEELQLLTIANLAQLELSAARTCLMLIGTEVAHLERNGEHQEWHPEQCWLAACESTAIGQISPHLLDRFALRLSWKKLMGQEEMDLAARSAWLRTHITQKKLFPLISLPETYIRLVRQAAQRQPVIKLALLDFVINRISPEHYTPRRELALARFAATLACLENTGFAQNDDVEVLEDHVEAAAYILGLTETQGKIASSTEQDELSRDMEKNRPMPQMSEPRDTPQVELVPQKQQQNVLLSEESVINLLEMENLCNDPYPEDGAPIEREAASLRMPGTRFSPTRSARGPIIGVETSTTLHDLALVSTMLAAAKFQVVRGHKAGEPLCFEPIDLRRYRRGFANEYELLLVLDYTSVRDHPNWRDILVPYLHEAYVKRAGVTIVKIGAQNNPSFLQAEMISAPRGVLVPGVGSTLQLEREQGYPTPLAHGLQMALGHLRHILQHGRSTVTHVTLIVVSDGRGNVPLQWSLRNQIDTSMIVTREGIEDALSVAQEIGVMKRVEAILVYPDELHHPELPRMLAEVLGAGLVVLPDQDMLMEA